MIVALFIMFLAVICIWVAVKTISNCFDDNDPDIFWYENYTTSKPSNQDESFTGCLHQDKTDIVMQSATTCEDIWTICDECNEVLDKRLEC